MSPRKVKALQQFGEFLQARGVLDEFQRGYEQHRSGLNLALIEFFADIPASDWILCAFRFERARGGRERWSAIDREWRDYLQALEEENHE